MARPWSCRITQLPRSNSGLSRSICRYKVLNHPKMIRSLHEFDDKGNSGDMVEANMAVLRQRMDEIRQKKGPWYNCYDVKAGWSYDHLHGINTTDFDHFGTKSQKKGMLMEAIELVGLVSGVLVFVFLFGSSCIVLVHLLAHLL